VEDDAFGSDCGSPVPFDTADLPLLRFIYPSDDGSSHGESDQECDDWAARLASKVESKSSLDSSPQYSGSSPASATSGQGSIAGV
jgi:hypothetical protein